MDHVRFDAFVRALTPGPSRRGMLIGLLGGVLAALSGWSLDESAAKKGKKGKKKKKKKKGGKPQCTGTRVECPDGCVDLDTDEDNCGTCNKRCKLNETCVGGVCLCVDIECGTSETCCDGGCFDTSSDESHCGASCVQCGINETCDSGDCLCAGAFPCSSAGTGFTCCDNDCVDTETDTNNCGSCGEVCAENATCEDGVCLCSGTGTECGAGFTCCFGECVDTDTTNEHCGSCGKLCTVNETCEAGICMCGQIRCGDGFTCCETGGCFCAPGPDGGFGTKFGSPVGTCEVEEVDDECPAGLTTCSGPEGFCRACCPANTTCDTGRGVCLPSLS